nr:unnamed protein product [Digitaria exilis]
MGSASMPKNVCVVGAGMSGLAAARELRREGLAVTVVEQRGDIGGQWLYDPRTDTDTADPLGATAPVKVHSSMYASVRLISPRECMGFSDFQFVPRPGAGRDARRFPGHREVYCYLKDFCAAFGLEDAVRLNTKVVRVAMAPPPSETTPPVGYYSSDVKWQVRSVRVEPDGDERVAVEEVFDAVVVANGHYSQPRLPSIKGMDVWQRRQLHSHSYRVPDPFHGEVVVVVGCGESGLDIATELCGVASGVHLTAKSMEAATTPTPVVSKLLSNHAEIQLRPPVDHLCEDGTVAFADGSCVVANTVIYCTGYVYSIPFLDTGGLVTVDGGGERVGPLYGHTFPPAMAPSLSFVGVPTAEAWEFVYRHSDLPRMEDWKVEVFMTSIVKNKEEDREAFRDRDDDSESVREELRRWRRVAGAQYKAALAAAAASGGDHADDAGAASVHNKPPAPCQFSVLSGAEPQNVA